MADKKINKGASKEKYVKPKAAPASTPGYGRAMTVPKNLRVPSLPPRKVDNVGLPGRGGAPGQPPPRRLTLEQMKRGGSSRPLNQTVNQPSAMDNLYTGFMRNVPGLVADFTPATFASPAIDANMEAAMQEYELQKGLRVDEDPRAIALSGGLGLLPFGLGVVGKGLKGLKGAGKATLNNLGALLERAGVIEPNEMTRALRAFGRGTGTGLSYPTAASILEAEKAAEAAAAMKKPFSYPTKASIAAGKKGVVSQANSVTPEAAKAAERAAVDAAQKDFEAGKLSWASGKVKKLTAAEKAAIAAAKKAEAKLAKDKAKATAGAAASASPQATGKKNFGEAIAQNFRVAGKAAVQGASATKSVVDKVLNVADKNTVYKVGQRAANPGLQKRFTSLAAEIERVDKIGAEIAALKAAGKKVNAVLQESFDTGVANYTTAARALVKENSAELGGRAAALATTGASLLGANRVLQEYPELYPSMFDSEYLPPPDVKVTLPNAKPANVPAGEIAPTPGYSGSTVLPDGGYDTGQYVDAKDARNAELGINVTYNPFTDPDMIAVGRVLDYMSPEERNMFIRQAAEKHAADVTNGVTPEFTKEQIEYLGAYYTAIAPPNSAAGGLGAQGGGGDGRPDALGPPVIAPPVNAGVPEPQTWAEQLQRYQDMQNIFNKPQPEPDRTRENELYALLQQSQQKESAMMQQYIDALIKQLNAQPQPGVGIPAVPAPSTPVGNQFPLSAVSQVGRQGSNLQFSNAGLGYLNSIDPALLQALMQFLKAQQYTAMGQQGTFGELNYGRAGGIGSLAMSDASFENPLNYAGLTPQMREPAEAGLRSLFAQMGLMG